MLRLWSCTKVGSEYAPTAAVQTLGGLNVWNSWLRRYEERVLRWFTRANCR